MESLDRPIWNPARRCTGNTHAGERCHRQPIPGGAVCILHGGGIPAVREAARMRLLAMVEPILSVFEEVVSTWRGVRCETCGRPTGDPGPVIQVGKIVLDRAGFGPSASLQVEQTTPTTEEDFSTPEALDLLQAKINRTQRMLDLVRQKEGVIDAFTVPEEDEDTTRSIPEGDVTINPETPETPKADNKDE